MRVPLEVGQIRDLGKSRGRSHHVLARVLAIRLREGGTPLDAEIAAIDGSRRRHKNPADLERCPVVDEQGRAVAEENAKPARPVERVIDDLRLRVAALEASILAADGPHKRDCSRPGLNFTAKCSCGLDALMGRTV